MRNISNVFVVYLGDSASLSYLDTIRKLVESTIGPCNFTTDAHKGKLVEGSLSSGLRPTYVLPDKEVADFLLESFFSNVSFNFPLGTCTDRH